MLGARLIRCFVGDPRQLSDPAVRLAYGRLGAAAGIAANLLLAAGKAAASVFSGSFALMADAVNNLSDLASGIVSLAGFRMAAKPADPEHPFGHARSEYLAALVVALLALLAGAELLRGGVEKILRPEGLTYSPLVTAGLAVSVLVKLWMFAFYRSCGRRIDSGTLLTAAADSRNDALATGAVLLSYLLFRYAGWVLDGWLGAGIALFILYSGWGMVKDVLDPLLGKAPDRETVNAIRKRILSYPGVLGTHDLIIHDYGPGRRFGSVHVEMSAQGDPMAHHDVMHRIEQDFLEEENLHLIVRLDPILTAETELGALRQGLQSLVQSLHPQLSIHDLRVVPGPARDKLVFDCVVPPQTGLSPGKLRHDISARVEEVFPGYSCAITFDAGYDAVPPLS